MEFVDTPGSVTAVVPTRASSPARSLEPRSGKINVTKVDDAILKSRISYWPPFSGIIHDVKARLPFYWSDWVEAWDYRVLPATAMIFFANVLPAIAFSLDLIENTGEYGVAEILMASFIGAASTSIFGAQPLVIVGVTGPITVLNKTIYDILEGQENPPNYLQFIGWVYFWGAMMHWVFAISNGSNFVRYITRFSCDTFGFFVAWVYLQYGVQMTTRQFSTSSPNGAYVSLILALLVLVTAHLFNALARSPYFHRHARRFLSDYGMPITVIAVSGCAYWGRFNAADAPMLPTGSAFQAANGRPWLVKFWELDAKWVGIAFPFGFALFVLFAFDHQISALIAQGSEFPLKKPPGFHWDFFLLGITTFISGLIGVPAPNGLIPQAPIHTTSLVVLGRSNKKDEEHSEHAEKESISKSNAPIRGSTNDLIPISVVEQRVSNLAQGSLCLVLLTGPFLTVLGTIPRGVLAGLFWFMGTDALASSGVTQKILFLLQDRKLTPLNEPLHRVRRSRLILFIAMQLLGFGATMAIVQTKAAIGFPVIIALLVPFRTWLIPKLPFDESELLILDSPTASAFTMESVGGFQT